MPTGQKPDDMHGLPPDGLPVVSDRPPEPEVGDIRPAHAGVLHFALVVPTLKLKKVLDQHIYAMYPPEWQGTLKIHILVKDPREDETGMLLRYLARESNLATSEAAGLLYPEEVELGWQDEPS